MNTQLTIYLVNNNILSEFQSGFRKHHSCVTATTKVLNDIHTSLDNKSTCAALFVDLSKAFDTVDHSILLNKLCLIGITDTPLLWFTNYFSHRSQTVKSENLTSQPLTITKGVPQGSSLGPTLFSIYINNLVDPISNASIHLYADDTIIYTSAPNLPSAMSSLQINFHAIQQALSENKLLLNSAKTKYMIFSNKKPTPSHTAGLALTTIDNIPVEQVSQYKYLGIWIDEFLNFSTHINNLQKKI